MDITINIGLEDKKLKVPKSPLLDDMEEEETEELESLPQKAESTTMFIGVDGITDTKPVPKAGNIAHKTKPEVQLGLED